jgi:hypothetical protein
MKFDQSLRTEGADRLRNLVLLGAQSQAPDCQAAPLQADEEIHALCEALIASEERSDP